ncbi:hypothetical protein D3C87_456080 [compost metagenome]
MRIDPLQIADQIDVQRTRLDAQSSPIRQPIQMGCCIGPLQIAEPCFFFQQLLRVTNIAVQEHTHAQPQIGNQPLVQLDDLRHPRFREVALRLDLLVLDINDHPLDDVPDLLHVDREADDVRPAPAFLFAQRLARDARHVVLDRRVQLVHRVVELPQLLRQPQVVVADHIERADQHRLHDVRLVQRLARRVRNGQRRRRQRRRIEVVRPARAHGLRRHGQHARHQLGDPLREADEADADHDVERQVEQHHAVRLVRQLGLHVAHPQPHERRDQRHAQRLEQQVAHRHLPHRHGRARRGQHRQQAAAQVGAEHQAQRHVERHHVRARHGRHQQHHRQA